MTPNEFEENARIISGDPTWSLSDCVEILPRQARALTEVGGPLTAWQWAVLSLPEWDFKGASLDPDDDFEFEE